jgi:hypothetical protein
VYVGRRAGACRESRNAGWVAIVALIFLGGQVSTILSKVGFSI